MTMNIISSGISMVGAAGAFSPGGQTFVIPTPVLPLASSFFSDWHKYSFFRGIRD